ncbi:MAG: flagellar filament capping protein FliD, partial [Synergistaceae bacterium]|nr:flagellar filament capping protein FliD [Synergistaceae bacterium]
SASATASDEDKDLKLTSLFEDVTLSESDYANLVIKNGSVTYTYGRDFTVTNGEIEWLPKYEVVKTYKTEEQEVTKTNEPEAYTLSYNGDVYDSTTDDDSVLAAIIAAADGDYENLTLTDSEGNELIYVEDANNIDSYNFSIVDGALKWYETTETEEVTVVVEETRPISINTPSAPDANAEYTVYYESFKPIEATATSDGDDEIEIQIANDYGKISNSGTTYLSYEQILKDINSKLTTSSTQSEIDEALADYFAITDADGETYTYGDDFIIKMGDEDLTSGQHKVLIEWQTSAPASGTDFTVSYTGRGEGGGEVFKINNAVTRSNSDRVYSGTSGSPVYSEFQAGTTTITQGTKTFFEGYDFEVSKDDDDNVVINWKTGTNWEWYYPTSGGYTINLTTESGESKTFTGYRGDQDTLDLRNFGFETVSNNGTLNSITYGGKTYDLTSTTTNDDGLTPLQEVKENLGLDISYATNGGVRIFNFDWMKSAQTSREGLPGIGDEIGIEYEYNTNTFSITDDGDGVVDLLGLNSDVTEAQNAILVLDGEEVQRDLNNIGESYGNELIKGMTINLKGVGEVSMDVSHDAEKAVESIQTFVENYNSLMSWMNTRMTESAVDEDTAATIDSVDFRMRWGLLHGNSLLRNTKSQMRDTVAQNFTFSFTSRTSSEEIYGSMSYNGLKNDSTLRLRINSTYVDVPILTTDTLQDIADKINNSENSFMHNVFYDSDGKLLDSPLLKAKIEGDKLVISSSSSDEITMSGTAAMNALKMNYTYKGVFQLGLATTSDDYGKSGELEFDTDKFMEALEDNPDEVQNLMLKFASSMDSWTKSMLNSSAS